MTRSPTPGQTIGPFFGYSLPYAGDNRLVPPGHPGSIRLHGLVLDGAGDPVPDALVELWQRDAEGGVVQRAGSLHRDPHDFTGWGRCATDATGRYSFTTLEPGPSASGGAFFALTVFARGLLDRLFTRAYLPSATQDAFLAGVVEGRRGTLVATADDQGYVFDVHLQGELETVFLDHQRE